MNEVEIIVLKKEIMRLRKEMDCLYTFIGKFIDLAGEEMELIKQNHLTTNTGKDRND